MRNKTRDGEKNSFDIESIPIIHQATQGILWSTIQRFGILGITFTSNIVLARLLTPSDFGYIGMIMVFIAISDSLISSGFDVALIQKKDPSNLDYSTVFYFNLTISSVIYLLLFTIAPLISTFYRMPQLTSMLRTLGFIVIINAFAIVQYNKLQKKLDFKKIAVIELCSMLISTILAIILAIVGLGVWSLIIRTLVGSALRCGLLWYRSHWQPERQFSFNSFKKLFGFGGYVFLSDMMETLINQIISLIIGRIYSPSKLGYYSQAKNLQRIPEMTIPFVINRVFFPIYSSIQDNYNKIIDNLRKSLQALSFITFPIMIILILIAKPLILFLYTDKWSESIVYFQILCLSGMTYSINSSNVTVLKALGKGKIILTISIAKRIVSLLFILIGSIFGIYGLIFGLVLSMYFWIPINTYFVGQFTGYGFVKQLKDIITYAITSITTGAFVLIIYPLIGQLSLFAEICLIIIFYFIIYMMINYIFNKKSTILYAHYLKSIIANKFPKTF